MSFLTGLTKVIHAIAGPPCQTIADTCPPTTATMKLDAENNRLYDQISGLVDRYDALEEERDTLKAEHDRLAGLHKEASAHFYRVSIEARNYKAERDYANDLCLRYYKADGTWDMLESHEEVVAARVQAAKDIAIYKAELAFHEDEHARQSKKAVTEIERGDHFQRLAQDRANEIANLKATIESTERLLRQRNAEIIESRKVSERLAEAKKRDAESYSNLIGHRNADILNLTQKRNDLADRHMDTLKVVQGLVRLADEYTAANYITPALDRAVDAGKVILAGYPGNTLEPVPVGRDAYVDSLIRALCDLYQGSLAHKMKYAESVITQAKEFLYPSP